LDGETTCRRPQDDNLAAPLVYTRSADRKVAPPVAVEVARCQAGAEQVSLGRTLGQAGQRLVDECRWAALPRTVGGTPKDYDRARVDNAGHIAPGNADGEVGQAVAIEVSPRCAARAR
jgi:hypothetical protein